MTSPANWSHFTFITKNLQWPLNIVKFQLDCLRISVFLPLQNGSFASQIHKALPHLWLRSLPSCPWRVRQQSYGDWLASRCHSNCPSLYSTSDFAAIMLEELTLLPWCKASPAWGALDPSFSKGWSCLVVQGSVQMFLFQRTSLPHPNSTPSHFPVFRSSAALRMGHGELPWHHLALLQMQTLRPHRRPQKSTPATLEMESVVCWSQLPPTLGTGPWNFQEFYQLMVKHNHC